MKFSSKKNGIYKSYSYTVWFAIIFYVLSFAHTAAHSSDIIFHLYNLNSSEKNDSIQILDTPVILNAGKNNFIVYHTLEPVLKWTNIKGANGYTIYIDEVFPQKNRERLLFNSPYYGLITSNKFKIFDDILEFNKIYKVKIRAYNKTSWSKYSDSVYIKIEIPKLATPQLKRLNQSGKLIIKSTTPIFRWNKIKYANGYTVYIDELGSNSSDTVFVSSYYGLVNKNEFIPFDDILQQGKKYRLRIRAYNEYVWSKYSEPLIFIIGEKFNKKIANDEYKLKINIIQNNNKKIVWNRIPNADRYNIVIEKKDESNIFGENYSAIVEKEITDTVFSLNEILVEGNYEYRWKIKAKTSNIWTTYTKYYKSGVSENTENKEIIDEIFFKIKYLGKINDVIIAEYKNESAYLPILELLSMLQINHNEDYKKKRISGYLNSTGTDFYEFNFNTLTAQRNGKIKKLKENDFIEEELEYFVKPEIINEILGLNLKIDFRKLQIKINSTNTPLYKRLINQKELSILKNEDNYKKYPLLYKRKHHLFKGLFTDYNFNATYINNQKPIYMYQIGFGAEVLGGDAELFHAQSSLENSFNFNQLEARWRYAFVNNRNISSVILGNNYANGLQSYEYRGIKISNKPLEERKIFGKHKIEDFIEPNWTVEIYKNNQLIDIVKSDNEGKFSFYLPFAYGTTLIELHLFGPNGEFKIRRKMYQIPTNQVPKGNLDYSLNLGALVSNNEKIFQGKASYGIADWLTTSLASDVFIDDIYNSSIYNITSARIFEGNIIDFKIAPNALVGFNINSLFPNLANINFGATIYDKNPKLNPGEIKNEINASLFYPISFGKNAFSFLINGRKLKYKNSNRLDFSARSYFSFNNFTPSLELKYFNYESKTRNLESTFLNMRLTYSFLFPLSFISGNIFDVRLSYNVNTEETESLNLTFSTTLFRKLRVQITHSENFNSSFSNTQLRVIYELPFLRSNSVISNALVSQTFSGSVSYLKNMKEMEFNNRQMVGKSAAAFRFYLDKNDNSILDKNEIIIPNMDVEISSVGNKKKRGDGTILINELEPYARYQTKLIERKNINPQWQPKFKKFTFITDPDNYKYIDIPFYEAAEVNGSVNKKINGRMIPVNGIKVIFENKKTNKTTTLKTLSDGTFYLYGIQPGKYKIYIDKKQLRKLKLPSTPNYFDAEIKSISNTEKEVEYNFILESYNN